MRRYDTSADRYEEEADRGAIQSASLINFILGAWLIISPYVLSYTTGAAKWNQTVFGIVILILAGLRALAPRQQWLSFLSGLAAIWLIIAPWALNYQASVAYWNEVIVAIVVAIVAFWNSSMTVHITGGRHHHAAT